MDIHRHQSSEGFLLLYSSLSVVGYCYKIFSAPQKKKKSGLGTRLQLVRMSPGMGRVELLLINYVLLEKVRWRSFVRF